MKIFTGVVLSKKMLNTATVIVERVVTHPIYQKRVKMTKKYQVHDELGTEVGQKVKFVASRPYSKTKKWIVTEVVKAVNKETKSKSIKSDKPKQQ